jgi:hypothetical protein
MYRAFQTAMVIHKPDVVFVLGEFLIKFGNLSHKISAVFILVWALEKSTGSCLLCSFFIWELHTEYKAIMVNLFSYRAGFASVSDSVYHFQLSCL